MNTMRQELEKRYRSLFEEYDIGDNAFDGQKIVTIIRQSLMDFLEKAENPAIYGFGEHTKVLMSGFIFELKKIKYIIDETNLGEDTGFAVITEDEIEKYGIDAIVLSSTYGIRESLKKRLKERFPTIRILDIYDEFEKEGMQLHNEYYISAHCYHYYRTINQLQRKICQESDIQKQNEWYGDLIANYLHIKDFRTAIIKLEDWKKISCLVQEQKDKLDRMQADIKALYELQKQAASSLSENHVLMFCIDGLRRQDLSDEHMPKMKKMFNEVGYQYTNAYGYSTSTYESLIPAYSENSDLRTKYYEKDEVELKECRFASLAKEQNREIYLYTDGLHYIEDETIHYKGGFDTVTERIWDFILDASEKEQALFYIHSIYETHFSYVNPYTEEELIAQGNSVWFDLFSTVGHCLTDYQQQHEDAIRYLDDVLEPLLRPMGCRMVVYADHGNYIFGYETQLEDLGDTEFTCSEIATRIPLIVRSPEMGVGWNEHLISLMEINNIIISLLQGVAYHMPLTDYIKMARSPIYNPEFKKIYNTLNKEKYLQAFECFLFANGRKVFIFEDGTSEMYDLEDNRIDDYNKNLLIEKIKEEITVCEYRVMDGLGKHLRQKTEKNILFLENSVVPEKSEKIRNLAMAFRKGGCNTLVLDIAKKQCADQLDILCRVTDRYKFDAMVVCDLNIMKDNMVCQCASKKIVLLEDMPLKHEEQLINFDKNTIVYCSDINDMEFVRRHYPDIGGASLAFCPDGFMNRRIPYSDKKIDILLIGDYISPEKLKLQIREKYTEEISVLVERLLEKMIYYPDKSYELALIKTLEDYGIRNVEDEELKAYLIEFQKVNEYLQVYYTDEIVHLLLQNGIKINVIGNGWKNFQTEYGEYLSIRQWNWYISQKEAADAKIILDIAPCSKAGIGSGLITGLLNNSVVVAHSNEYLRHNFKDMENIVLYQMHTLNALDDLLKKIKVLLSDEDAASKIARNGKRYAEENYSWENTVSQIFAALNLEEHSVGDTLCPGRELALKCQGRKREDVAADVLEELLAVDIVISELQTCDALRTEDYWYCVDRVVKAVQDYTEDFGVLDRGDYVWKKVIHLEGEAPSYMLELLRMLIAYLIKGLRQLDGA